MSEPQVLATHRGRGDPRTRRTARTQGRKDTRFLLFPCVLAPLRSLLRRFERAPARPLHEAHLDGAERAVVRLDHRLRRRAVAARATARADERPGPEPVAALAPILGEPHERQDRVPARVLARALAPELPLDPHAYGRVDEIDRAPARDLRPDEVGAGEDVVRDE